MKAIEDKVADFLSTVPSEFLDFVTALNDSLIGKGCTLELKTAKSGYVASYLLPESKKTLATFVFRKTGMRLRIYGTHVGEYEAFLDTLPPALQGLIAKASPCKRLLDPKDCNPKCPMGYTFTMAGQHHQKCRQMAFLLPLSQENNPYLLTFLEKELACASN